MLPLCNRLFQTKLSDPEMLELSARHYSRKNYKAKKIGGPARSILLRNNEGTVLFLWQWPKDGTRWDKQNGYNCVMFRNESKRLSSEIILEAEDYVMRKWGPNRFYTYVDASKVSSNPGYCFKKAGWKRVGISGSGKILLEKFPNEGLPTAEDVRGILKV